MVVYASRFAPAVLLNVAVCQPNVFRHSDYIHQILKDFPFAAVGVQLILNALEVIVFGMA
jgi:hypothetical protein